MSVFGQVCLFRSVTLQPKPVAVFARLLSVTVLTSCRVCRTGAGVLHRLRQRVDFENVVKLPAAVVATINHGLTSPSSPNPSPGASDLQAPDSAPSSPADDGATQQLTLEMFQEHARFLLAPPLPPPLMELREAFSKSPRDSNEDQLASLLIRCVTDSKVTPAQLIHFLIHFVLVGLPTRSSTGDDTTLEAAAPEVPTAVVNLIRLLKATSTLTLLRALTTQGTKDKRPIHSLYASDIFDSSKLCSVLFCFVEALTFPLVSGQVSNHGTCSLVPFDRRFDAGKPSACIQSRGGHRRH